MPSWSWWDSESASCGCKLGPLTCGCVKHAKDGGQDSSRIIIHSHRYDVANGLAPEAAAPNAALSMSPTESKQEKQKQWQASGPQQTEPKRTGGIEQPSADVPEVGESLDWLNHVLKSLWPNISTTVECMLKCDLLQQLKKALPQVLQGIHFTKCTLGEQSPRFSNVRVFGQNSGTNCLEIELHITLQSDLDVELEIPHIGKLGVNRLAVDGDLALRFEPLLDEAPIVGGVVFYFHDTPSVDLGFSGLGDFAQYPQITSLIRGQLDQVIADFMVLPNVQCHKLGTRSQGVDFAHLKRPSPIGVLRVTALSGAHLKASDWHLFSAPTSDPYLRVALADQVWKSPPVKATCNPIWPAGTSHDFLVYDQEQQLRLDVFDEDLVLGAHLTKDDHIGRADAFTVMQAIHKSEKDLPLFDPGTPCDANRQRLRAGNLRLRCEWFELKPNDLTNNEQCVIEVKVENVYMPGKLGHAVGLRARIYGQTLETKLYEYTPQETDLALRRQREQVARRCVKCGKSRKDIMHVTRLDDQALEALFGKTLKDGAPNKSLSGDGDAKQVLELDCVLRFAVPTSVLDHEGLELELFNDQVHTVGTVCIPVVKNKRIEARRVQFESESKQCVEAYISVVVFGLHARELTQKVNHMSTESHERRTSKLGRSSHVRTKTKVSVCGSLDWMNEVLLVLWPHLDLMVAKVVKAELETKVNELVPMMHVVIEKCTLGRKPPILGPIKVKRARGNGYIQILLGVWFDSDIELSISSKIVNLGVKSLSFRGELCIRLTPILNEAPVVGGMVAYFLDPPKIDFKFLGAAKLAHQSSLMSVIRSQLEAVLLENTVMPNVLGIPFGTEEQQVDRAHLNCPAPIGGLKVTAVRARELLAGDINLFSARTSDPFVKVAFGDACWKSATVYATLNPVWTEGSVSQYFLVYDMEQCLRIDVYDEDVLSGDDPIGHAHKITVKDAISPEYSGVEMALFDPSDMSKSAGFLQMKFEWVDILGRGEIGPVQCIVEVKVDEVFLPVGLGKCVALRAMFKDHTKTTPLMWHDAEESADAVAVDMKEMVKRCKERSFSPEEVRSVSDEASPIEKNSSPSSAEGSVLQVDLERMLRFIIPTAQILPPDAVLHLALIGDKQVRLGEASVSLAGVVSSGPKTQEGTEIVEFKKPGGTTIEAEVSVSLRGLAPVAGDDSLPVVTDLAPTMSRMILARLKGLRCFCGRL